MGHAVRHRPSPLDQRGSHRHSTMSTTHNATPYPMTNREAKAQGLKVFPSWTSCRKAPKHGNLRLTTSNRCATCAQMEADIKRDLRAKVGERLKAQADRQAMKRVAQALADAQRKAQAIIKAAEREAMDKVKMQERAKATREANKAKSAAQAAAKALSTAPPTEPLTGGIGGLVEAVGGSGLVDPCPWD